MILLPNLASEVLNKLGSFQSPWVRFLQQFAQAPSPILPLTVAASPFAYQVLEPGAVLVSGGTVSSVLFTRGTTSVTLQIDILIPVCIGDIITTTYSVLPTIRFFPNYATPRT